MLVAITGAGLTTGTALAAQSLPQLPVRLAGTQVRINGMQAGLYSVSPERVVARVPPGLATGADPVNLELFTGGPQSVAVRPIRVEPAVPGVVAAARVSGVLVIYATGTGTAAPEVLAADRLLTLEFAGAAPGYPGLVQINARLPEDLAPGSAVRVRAAGKDSNAVPIP
jgi:hypothetical protein